MVKKISLTASEKKIVKALNLKRKSVFARFPLLFTVLATFGLVATLYGFERVIDEIAFLSDNPLYLLGTGLIILVITGGLYKKLQ